MSHLQRRAWLRWLLGPALLSLVMPPTTLTSPAPAHSSELTPVVEIARAGSDRWLRASTAPTLVAGDRLRTAPGSTAQATLPDGSLLALGSATGVRVERADADGVALAQTAGLLQARLPPSPASGPGYSVATAAAITTAPPVTCPWLRVNPDDSVLVRNYAAGPLPPVPPQPVDEVYYVPATVMGPNGPVQVPMPRTVSVLQDLPIPATAEDQPLAACPFGEPASAGEPAPLAADEPPAVAPLLGSTLPVRPGAASADRSLRVRNTWGQRIKTDFLDGQRMKTVRVPPGYETLVRPGETPAPPEPIGTFAARDAARQASIVAAERAVREIAAVDRLTAATDPAASLPPALVHLPFVGSTLVADLFRLLSSLPLPADPASAQGVTGLQSLPPCTTIVGGTCTIQGKGVYGDCTKIGSMSCLVRVSLAAAGATAFQPQTPRVVFVTSRGVETFPCAPLPANPTTLTCTGVLAGDLGLGAPLTVYATPLVAINARVEPPDPNALREPPVRRSLNGVLDTTLSANLSAVSVAGLPTVTMNYENSYPGPTLRFRPGDLLRIKLTNNLSGLLTTPIPPPIGNQLANASNATNLHTHGLHVSPLGTTGDNVFLTIPPGGGMNQYAIPIPLDHPSGLFWYHPHFHGNTEDQIFAGMMGMMIVEGALDQIPGIAGLRERLMVFHQIQLTGQGTTTQRITPQTPLHVLRTINGQYQPTIHMAPGETQRWRLGNTSADGTFVLFLEGHTFTVIATDGNTLRQPVTQPTLNVQPAQRYEVLVTCQGPGTYELRSLPFLQGFLNEPDVVLGTVVCDGTTWNPQPLPTTLLPVPDLRAVPVVAQRTWSFGTRNRPVGPPDFTINDMLFNPLRVDVRVKLGTVEEWRMVNTTEETHPIHIHQNPFQVISVNGVPYNAPGYNDTFLLPIGVGSEFTLRTAFEDFVGTFVFHCHIAFHEDAGMMLVIEVEP